MKRLLLNSFIILTTGPLSSLTLAQENIKESAPNEAPYVNPEETENSEDSSALKAEAIQKAPLSGSSNANSSSARATKSPLRSGKELGPNPYADGEYRGRKDRFGRPDPRNRTFSKENDELVRKGLLKISKSGEFSYSYPESDQKHSLGIRVGLFSPPSLINPQTGQSFQTIYGQSSRPMILLEYEWQLLQLPIGKMGLAIGSGIYTATGNGFYKNPNLQPPAFPRAEEVYSFYLFPNSLSAIYRLQFFDRQIIVPYASAGVDYFGILETRDDGGSTRFGGGSGIHFGGGASIQLDFLSRESMFELDQEFGINHIYLTIDYKYIQGFSSFDVTQNLLSGGILAEF
ncbi:MAG: hypothetical protein K2X47_16990 [Bdellovibrionales bacterium]|nr:hypothetical protein [Bdellovibrionales bacterium]